MDVRETLRRDPKVANDDIDDIVGIAQELQDAAQERQAAPSLSEVQDVARELDIAPEYVQQALEVLRSRRQQQAAERAQARAEQIEVAAARRRMGIMVASTLAVMIGLSGMGVFGLALVGSSEVQAARQGVERTEVQLDVVLDRQASLAPQLVAMAGGDAASLSELAATVRDAPTTEARIAASEALGDQLAQTLGTLPPPSGDAEAQQRRDLQHELSGSQNRITTERRRYEEARTRLEQAQGTPGGWLASLLGL